jgi:hypothetical protein
MGTTMIVGRLLGMVVAAVDMMIVGRRLDIKVDLMIEDRLDMEAVEAEDTTIEVLLQDIISVGDMMEVAVDTVVIGREEDHPVRRDVGDTDFIKRTIVKCIRCVITLYVLPPEYNERSKRTQARYPRAAILYHTIMSPFYLGG